MVPYNHYKDYTVHATGLKFWHQEHEMMLSISIDETDIDTNFLSDFCDEVFAYYWRCISHYLDNPRLYYNYDHLFEILEGSLHEIEIKLRNIGTRQAQRVWNEYCTEYNNLLADYDDLLAEYDDFVVTQT